jgi:hypothetical protein
MARKTIRLIDDDGSFLYWTDTDDARNKLQSGLWEEVYQLEAGSSREKFLGLRKRNFDRSSDSQTPCTITARESAAAVGAGVLGVRDADGILQPDEHEQRSAQQKIRAWPLTVGYVDEQGRNCPPKAVTICAGRVYQPEVYQPKGEIMKALQSVAVCLLAMALAVCVAIPAHAQAVPQYSYGISFLGSGVYNQTNAVDNVFGYQLTTNLQAEADLLTAPGGGVSDYEGGATYDPCGFKPIENLLMNTSIPCGKIQPFFGGTVGVGRVQQGSGPMQDGVAFMVKAGISLPNSSGAFAVAAEVGYGDFGASIPGQSNKGIFFNLPVIFGAGNNVLATQARRDRLQRAEAKKQIKFQAAFCKANPQAANCKKTS